MSIQKIMTMGFALVVAYAAHAAPITWQPATTVAGDSDVAADGALLYAVRFYSAASTDPTLNGVTFTAHGTNVAGTADYQDGIGAPSALSAAYRQLLGSDTYKYDMTITLNYLIVGRQYKIQVWANDARFGAHDSMVTVTAINTVSLNRNVNATGYGQYAIGTFTADATELQVNVVGGAFNALQVRDMTVTAGPVDAATSTVVASPNVVPADNTITSTITVTLKDASGISVSDKVVTLASSRGATDTISPASGTSSASGVVTFTVKSSTPGTAVFSATDVTDSNLAITQTANVTFISAIAWGEATTVSGDSDVAADGALLYAVRFYNAASTDPALNGVTFTAHGTNVTLTANYQDGLGAPSALSAAYRQLLGSDIYSDPTITLNYLIVGHQYKIQVWANDARGGAANSMVTFTGTNTLILNRNVNATGYGQYAIGTFTADATNLLVKVIGGAFNALQVRDTTVMVGPVDEATSTVVASPNVIPADNTITSTITVTLKDASGISVSNKVVTLASSRGATDTISAASGPSGAAGSVTFTVTSSTPGTAVFSATDVTDGNLAITQTANVTFNSPIAWGPPTTVAGDSDVATDGALLYAVRFYSAASTDPTLNGVTFTAHGTNVTGTADYQDGIGAPPALSAAYQQLLGSDTYNSDMTITLNYLIVGHQYKIQVWANDARFNAHDSMVTVTAPNTVSLNRNVNATGYGQYAIGTFTADATNRLVKVVGVVGGGAFNAIQVRDITTAKGTMIIFF